MNFNAIRRQFEPLIRRLLHVYWYFARGLTIGVRAAVFDGEGRVFLVKHTYIDGWHLPGGGVERGETIVAALERELREEGNIEVTELPVLHAVHYNRRASRRDHVVLYVVRSFRQTAPPQPNREIASHGFFPTGALPADTSRATRERIAEILTGRPAAEIW